MHDSDTRTRAFSLYEEGRAFNSRLVPDYYTLVDTNAEFFIGNQWLNLPETPETAGMPKPVFNIIKRITSVLVAQITSGGLSVNLEPLSYYTGGPGDSGNGGSGDGGFSATEFAQAEVNNLLEKFKLEYRMREALFDGARTGDYCAHFYWDPLARPYGGASGGYRGEIRMELVDGVNIMFGNPNTPEVEDQPYILLIGRDTVKNLRAEYLRSHPGDYEGARAIRPDSDWTGQTASSGKLELTNEDSAKCLYIYLYELTEDPPEGPEGTENAESPEGREGREGPQAGAPQPRVVVTKCTRGQTIFERAETGLSRYPIAWANWERQKNCYHGRALVTGVIPNQIFINTMYAMVMRHLQLEAFPKIVFNADLVPCWTNDIGSSIGVHGIQPGENVAQVASIIKPADMSGQILSSIDRVVELTQDCLGVTDVQLGTQQADNTSAIMVVQQNAEVPLDNIRAGLYEWMEDIVKILLDMMGTYYGRRPIVRSRSMQAISEDPVSGAPLLDPATGMLQTVVRERRVLEPFDFSQLKEVWLKVRVDVGSSTAYSEIAMTQTLDNLREAGLIDLVEYLERVPDKLIPMKQDLIDRQRQQNATAGGVTAGSALPDGSPASGQTPVTAGVAPDGQAEGKPSAGNGRKKKTVTKYLFDKALDTAKVTGTLSGSQQSIFAKLPTSVKSTLAKNAGNKLNR